MTKREEQYRINLYEKFEKMLNRFMDSNTVEWRDKEKVLIDFKDTFVVQMKIVLT